MATRLLPVKSGQLGAEVRLVTEKFSGFEEGLHAFCNGRGVASGKWRDVPRSQVIDIFAPVNTLVYVKDSALPSGWWGIAYTVFNKLVASGREWCLVLLVRDAEEGYLLTETQVNGMVSGLSTNATEYILHEADAAAGVHFKTFQQVYKDLVTTSVTA
jgi:hypothetical protein